LTLSNGPYPRAKENEMDIYEKYARLVAEVKLIRDAGEAINAAHHLQNLLRDIGETCPLCDDTGGITSGIREGEDCECYTSGPVDAATWEGKTC
jgi:hypothetical protein